LPMFAFESGCKSSYLICKSKKKDWLSPFF
jgi:hypothetical protein